MNPTTCGRCDTPLTLVFGHPDDLESNQRDNALHVELTGGYGMFGDWIGDHPKMLLCHNCAVALMRWLGLTPPEHRGLHPYDEAGKPCCEYGWTTEIVDGRRWLEYGTGEREDITRE